MAKCSRLINPLSQNRQKSVWICEQQSSLISAEKKLRSSYYFMQVRRVCLHNKQIQAWIICWLVVGALTTNVLFNMMNKEKILFGVTVYLFRLHTSEIKWLLCWWELQYCRMVTAYSLYIFIYQLHIVKLISHFISFFKLEFKPNAPHLLQQKLLSRTCIGNFHIK